MRDNNKAYDLVLMDIQMPGLDGLETTRQIRDDHRFGFRDIPIIGFSGESDEKEISRAFNVGMNDYLIKPIDNMLLIRKSGSGRGFEIMILHNVMVRYSRLKPSLRNCSSRT